MVFDLFRRLPYSQLWLKMSSTKPQAVADAIAARAAASQTPQFLVVYASIVNGKSWCGDCIAAEPLLNKKFAGEEAERLTVHYAGDRET